MGAYVSLLEYNGIEGMILLSELSRRRIRSVSKLIKVHRPTLLPMLRPASHERPLKPDCASTALLCPCVITR